MTRTSIGLSAASVLVVLSCFSAKAAEKLPREHVEFFEAKVRPILVQHCFQCHAEDSETIQGGLVLDSKQGWMKGGDNGPAITPGEPDESLLIHAVRYEEMEMPPKGMLPETDIAVLERWVKIGAPDPRDKDTTQLIKREIDLEKGRQYWAFQGPQKRSPPAVRDTQWPQTDVDRFVLAKLEAEGLQPVDDADAGILVRRLYFDLIGLPPTREEFRRWKQRLEAVARNERGRVVEQLVDELLASPHFGERWGRHWLDVARYAESTGMERNVTFPAAWRYRDYVIDAFNADKPYDQFLREQIAGDLLPGTTKQNREERIVATGFLAMGPKSLNERDRNVFTMDLVDEQIDVTTRAILGVTVSCARCHDHKFDPFPQRDYYALAGIFRSCKTYYGATGGQGNRQPSSLIALGSKEKSETSNDGEANKNQQRIAQLSKQLKQVRAELKSAGNDEKQVRQLRRNAKQINQQLARLRGGKKNKGGDAKLPPGPAAMGVVDDDIADCPLHIRGNTQTLGKTVPRGFLQVLPPDLAPSVGEAQSGRLELAQYLSSADNPLTARVMVNRVWHWLFGQGIVRTVDNFGTMGERPSNEELLDHLAARFVEEEWSVKQLVREIVLSRTYQLTSDHDASNFTKDPENLLVWRQNHRRLDAESLRDAVLAISGQLDREPATSSPVAKMVGVNIGRQARELDQIDSGQFRHRSVYIPILRNALPEALAVFDFAEPSIIVGRRQITTVPSQALYMMNSDFVVSRSKLLAERLWEDNADDSAERIAQAYEATLCRRPTADELHATQEFLESFNRKGSAEKVEHDALAAVCQALIASAEFRYVE